jgi:UvrD-like helicase C-terminal domain
MTGAERSWASHYEINDVVRYTRGSKAIGIEAAAYASVVAINPYANQLTVEKANGELATYDPRRLTGLSVYQEIQREFSIGDRIQFTAPDKSLGVANRDMAAIEAIHRDGRLSVRLDNDRQIEFNPNEHRHLDHGYAVTSHSSQGLTAERVLVHADTSVHPDLLNSRFGYVSISRASHEATLFTDDMARLGPQLGADVSKTSALEISQGSSIAQAFVRKVVRRVVDFGGANQPKGLRPHLHFRCFLNRAASLPAQTSKHSNRSPIRVSPSRGGAGGPAVDPLGAAS